MDRMKIIGIGIAIFFVCMLIFHIIAHEIYALTFGVCLIFSLIITALALLFLSLHLRISRLEHQVELLRKQLYQLEEIN